MGNIPQVELFEQDRVAVVKDGKIVKGRVAEVLGSNAVRVTFAKDDGGTLYERGEVLALYRYAQAVTPLGVAMIPIALCAGQPGE